MNLINKKLTSLDRRMSRRYESTLPVRLTYSSDDDSESIQLPASSVSISEYGVSFMAKNPPPRSKVIQLAVDLPQPFPNVTLSGKIAWSNFISKENTHIVGVALNQGQDEKIDVFRSYIASISEAHNGDRRKLDSRRVRSTTIQQEKRGIDRRGQIKIFDKARRFISKRVSVLKNTNLYFYLRTLESPSAAHIIVEGKEMIMFGSNNYLGLTVHPKVKEAAIKATEKYGAGAGAVRLLGGTLDLHNQLEEKLANFKGCEAAIIYSAGYTANLATISSLVSSANDLAFIDEKDHASIIDGLKLSRAKMRVFSHNDMADLERKLSATSEDLNKIIIVDGVYSMDGDIANLMEIYRLAKRFNATVMIDEAHATGVIGRTGRGTPEFFGLQGRIEVVMGTLSKALGGIGGFVAGSHTLIDFLKHSARAFVFSSALPPAICASVMAAIDVIKSEPEWVKNLHKNEKLFRNGLQKLGFDTALSQTAIIPVIIGDEMKTYEVTRALHNEGIYVSPVTSPAVKRGTSRIRVSVMATHSEEDIGRALGAFGKVGRALSII